jgi:hypothetical protein
MHKELILEVLIEFAIVAHIIVGTGSKINPLFEIMQAGTAVGGQLPIFKGPVDDFSAPTLHRSAGCRLFAVFLGQSPQDPVEPAAGAMKISRASLGFHHTGLHPDTRTIG